MSSRWQRLVVIAAALAGLSGVAAGAWPALQLNAALTKCIARDGVSDTCEPALDNSNPRAQYYSGLAAWRAGKPEMALPLLRAARAADPRNHATALVLGQAMRATGDAPGAVAVWREAGAFSYFLQRARSLTSLDDARIAVELDPANAHAHEVMGRILEGQGRLAEAATAYRQAIDTAPSADVGLTALLQGHERRLLGDTAGAVAAYQRAVDAAPSAVPSLFLLADASRKHRDFDRAETSYRRLLEIAPNDVFAGLGLAEVWLTAGDTARAAQLFEQIAIQAPQNGTAPGYLGQMALQRGDLPEARRRLEEAVAREPQLGWAHAMLGDARRAQGDNAGAVQAYREAVRLDPSQAGAAEQLRLLDVTGQTPR